MRKFKAMTWKRTWLWSSSPHIEKLNLGPMTPEERVCEIKTTTSSVDKEGKKRFSGNKNLKGTQHLGLIARDPEHLNRGSNTLYIIWGLIE